MGHVASQGAEVRGEVVAWPSAAPTVSLVVPVHRVTPAFERCLAAVRALDPAPHEVVVVVDGADPDVVALAEGTGAVVVPHLPRSGPAAARNAGAARARGDVLFFVDADVEVPPDVVARVAGHFAVRPDVDALIGSYDDEPSEGNFFSQYKNLLNHFVHQHAHEEGSTFWGACGAIRREVFERIGGFDEEYLEPSIEDIELGYRLRAAGGRVRVAKDVQVRHLKRWDARSLLHADLLRRALPWSALILRTGRLDNDLNVGTTERVKAALAVAAVPALLAAPRRPLAALAAVTLVAAVLVLDRREIRFFAHARGRWFAARAAAFHLAYHLYSAGAFALALGRHLVAGEHPVVRPWPGSPRRPATWDEPRPLRPVHAPARVPGQVLARRSRAVRRAIPVVLLIALGLPLLPAFRDVVGADGLSYVSVARHVAEGRWAASVNGYWGPLYSWLLAPFLAVGVDALLATKLLQLLVGAGTLLGVRRVALACGTGPATADSAALVAVPLVLFLALQAVMADLLHAMLLLAFCAELLHRDLGRRPIVALRAGLWAGLAFLAKAYTLPVVLVGVGVVVALRVLAHRPEEEGPLVPAALRLAGQGLVVVGVAAALVAPWVAVLSWHYGELTLSRTIGYNLAVAGPGSHGNPMDTAGLLPPAPHALSAWDDPSLLPLEADGPATTSSAPSPWRLVGNVAANLRTLAWVLRDELGVVVLAAAVGAVALARRLRFGDAAVPWLGLLAVAGAAAGGYLLTFVEPRYLWFPVLALVPLAVVAVDVPLRPREGRPQDVRLVRWRVLGVGALAVAVAVQAAQLPPPDQAGVLAVDLAGQLAAAGVAPAAVASNDVWVESAALCLHLGCTYLGETDLDDDRPPTANELRAQADDVARLADHYLVWSGVGDGGQKPPVAPLGPVVAEARRGDVTVVVHRVERPAAR